jgi:hypothetical protein
MDSILNSIMHIIPIINSILFTGKNGASICILIADNGVFAVDAQSQFVSGAMLKSRRLRSEKPVFPL